MKRFKKLLVLFSLLLVLGLSGAGEAYGAEYYNTNEYNVTMEVAEDNSFWMTEEIKVTYTEPRHGIYRYIPLSGTAYSQVDGNVVEQKYTMKVDGVSVEGYELQTYTENGNLVMQIGSGNFFVEGQQTYRIHYRVRLFDDGIDAYDSLYYNVVPYGWGTTIEKSQITIQMPKEFDASKAEFIAGLYGATDVNAVNWQVAGNAITGMAVRPLELGEGVTFRLVLPEGYFSGEMNTSWALALLLLIIAVLPLLSALLWMFFGRDPKVVQTVEFYPPEQISPAEVGYVVDGMVDEKDLVSLVIYFAEKGYLTLQELEDKEFLLIKNKDSDESLKVYESTFFNGLFHERDSVTLAELKGDFYGSYQATAVQLKAHFRKNKENRIFTHSSLGARALGILLMILPILAVALLGPIYVMLGLEYSAMTIPLMFLMIAGYTVAIVAHDKRDATTRGKYKAGMVAGVLLAGVGLLGFAAYYIFILHLSIGVLALVSSLICFVFTLRMKQRTKKSAELLGKILGFKEFIRTAELDRIKKLSEENPSYFYDVLPYAYVLGLNDKWAKKFEGIAVEPPVWYNGSGNTIFNTWVFMNMFNGFTHSMSGSIVPPTPKGGDGGLGGGGFSGGGGFGGGGFGGGGGGSW